jgi:hypothetical protein
MGIDGLSNLIEGGQMEEQDIPREEMTAEEAAKAGVEPPNTEPPAPGTSPDDAQQSEADQVQRAHEDESDGDGDGDGDGDDDESDPDERTDDPKPVDDPNLPEDGDPDKFESEPIQPGDFDQSSEESGERREDPADLSGVEKEFDED